MPWTLDWQDEFDGPAGMPPNPAIWHAEDAKNYETGTLNWYRPQNVVLDGQGRCVITAKPESYEGFAYTSGRIETQTTELQNLKTTPAGNWAVESRCQIPVGKGLWPCCPFYLGADWNYDPPPGRTWPQCGEIDHNEWYGLNRNQIRCNVVKANGSWLARVITLPFNIDEGFHTYRTECQGDEIRCLVDGVLYTTFKRADIPNWVGTYDQPFILIAQLEVGGNGGTPDATTPWPAKLLIDFIRCYRWEPDATPPPPTGGTGMVLTASQFKTKSDGWNLSGTDLYAWSAQNWVEYEVTGPLEGLTVVGRNHPHASLPPPSNFNFQLNVALDGASKGTLVLACDTIDRSAAFSLSVPAGTHRVRLTWTNDAYQSGAGGFDANLRLKTLEFLTAAPPPPPPPPPSDPKATARTKLKGLGLTDAEVDVVIN